MKQKKAASSKPKVRVDLPWNSTVDGVLKHAISIHEAHGYTDIIVIATRRTQADGVTPIDTFTFTSDRFRLAGIVQWALSRMLAK